MIRPKILMSKCLELEACRFNGQFISDSFVRKLLNFVDVVSVCPEVAIGLGIPRNPVSIYENKESKKRFLIQSSTELDLTEKIGSFSKRFVSDLIGIDGAILKVKSPSCGLKDARIRSLDKGFPLKNSSGFFAKEVLEKYSYLSIEDEKRLSNDLIREHFLIKLFLFARLREALSFEDFVSLQNFHKNSKFIIMMYSQNKLKELGRVLAKHSGNNFSEIRKEYLEIFYGVFEKMPKKSNIINTLVHIYGFFKKDLNEGERKFFFSNLDMFEEDRIPFVSIIGLLNSWAIRFDEKYILEQDILNPFPSELVLFKNNFR